MATIRDTEWSRRVIKCVADRGHDTVTAFIEAHPSSTMFELARDLGDGVSPDQLVRLYRAEAGDDVAAFAAFARSCLTRRVLRIMPKGWGVSPGERAHVFGSWSNDVGSEFSDAATRVFHVLADIAPRGWSPRSPDDPYLLKAFERWAP